MPDVPHLAFASPRVLPRAASLPGRVVVLDIAFAAKVGDSVSFDKTTAPFLADLGDRLAAWVDHHDHERHADFADDPRFRLATKAQHGACPEMITPELVRQTGPIDTIVAHVDLDGLYAAAKWILGGKEPYPGADDDARAVDTRRGTPGPRAIKVDHALRARFRDDQVKRAVVLWLVHGMQLGAHDDLLDEAAHEFEERAAGTAQLAGRFGLRGRVALVDVAGARIPYDKTDLLLAGQELAPVSMVRDSGNVTIAARFGSGWDFVRLLELGGGMPTRVSVPDARWQEALDKINAAPEPTPTAEPGAEP
ncbi:MAG: hypothetical protein H6708_26075 [Kofleriaceae bacterium]|nr:hypothetical protein [Myxococcales bacterium]MCB9563878.1 hypothetical protein [Kofleriaceae bacterium]